MKKGNIVKVQLIMMKGMECKNILIKMWFFKLKILGLKTIVLVKNIVYTMDIAIFLWVK